MIRLLVFLIPLAYVSWHLWMLMPLPSWGKWTAVALLLFWFALAIVGVSRYCDSLPMWLATTAYNVGCTSVIVLAYLLILFLAADLLRLVHVLPTAWIRDSLPATIVLAGVMAVVLVWGNLHYLDKKRVEVALDGHGKLEQHVKAVCVSDLHLGYHNRRAELARWVNLINAEHPDMVLLAGDLIDRSLRPLLKEDMAAELRRIEAPVYACMGNHEYYASYYYSPSAVERFYADAGITMLRDSMVANNGVAVVGRDDRSNKHRLPVAGLKDKFAIPDNQFTILLDHQPYDLDEAEHAGIDFQLSGHTHRGQFWPVSWITDALYECSWGSHRRGGTDYYVTSGLGIWGPKYRIGTQSEYIVVTIN